MQQRRATILTILGLLFLTMLGTALTPLLTPTSDLDSDLDGDFATFMAPRLDALLASTVEVETMVDGRSRNVLALRAEAERIETIAEEIDSWLVGQDLASAEREVADDYNAGIVRVRRAIAAAYDAIGSFDFSEMPGMIPVFSEGRAYIESALEAVRTETEAASSYTVVNALSD